MQGKVASPSLDTEPIIWVVEGSACCVLLVTLLGTVRTADPGLGKELL